MASEASMRDCIESMMDKLHQMWEVLSVRPSMDRHPLSTNMSDQACARTPYQYSRPTTVNSQPPMHTSQPSRRQPFRQPALPADYGEPTEPIHQTVHSSPGHKYAQKPNTQPVYQSPDPLPPSGQYPVSSRHHPVYSKYSSSDPHSDHLPASPLSHQHPARREYQPAYFSSGLLSAHQPPPPSRPPVPLEDSIPACTPPLRPPPSTAPTPPVPNVARTAAPVSSTRLHSRAAIQGATTHYPQLHKQRPN